MSLFMEIETDRKLPFDARKIAELVIETSLDYVKCPYETEVSLLLTTDEEIKEINRMQRQIDRATDVLSFPMADYETPGDFSHLDEDAGLFHPDTGELMLGDIVISVDKVFEQAEEYGHSLLREYAFLIAHSRLQSFRPLQQLQFRLHLFRSERCRYLRLSLRLYQELYGHLLYVR